MLPVDCSTTFKIWLWGIFGQQLNGIGPLHAIHFAPTFVSLTLWHFAGWPAHMNTWDGNWKILQICCGSNGLLASSLGLLLRANVPQFIPKFVFVSHRFFFFFQLYIVYFRNKDLEAELKRKCKSLAYIISHRTDPAVTWFQAWFNSPCVSGFPSFILSCFVSWTLPSWGWHSDMLLTYPFIFQPWLSLFNP